MDGQRFDDLTRTLTSDASRRRLLRGLVGAALGTLGVSLGQRRALAVCSAYGRVCAGTGCCTTPGAECHCYPNGHCRCLCPPGSSLVDGTCLCCATGETACPPGECCSGDQVCGLVGVGQQGCCLPVDAAIPGGCSGNTELCCGFDCGPDCFVQGCSDITNLCINPID